ncbi:MAG: transglutaminase-like domain-containing protein [Cyclobacteriaceae bacterium]
MNEGELKALVSLLEDEDTEVSSHVEGKIVSLGSEIIPFLEKEWEKTFNPIIQKKIEDLIHQLQFENLQEQLMIWKAAESDNLLKGMWLVASYQYPDISFENLIKDFEQLYYDTWLEFKNDLDPFDQVKVLNSVIYNKLKFRANTKNFHSPSNSMINIVMESKRGNPITLCVIYMMVAQKLKLPIYGVNLPNLFILTYKTEKLQFYINAFNKGLIFSRDDIDHYINNLNLVPQDLFYEPCGNVEIIQRAFRNLIVAFEKIGEYTKADEVKTLLKQIEE